MVENECKLDTDVDEYVDKFKWELMQVVHAWASVRIHTLYILCIRNLDFSDMYLNIYEIRIYLNTCQENPVTIIYFDNLLPLV